MKVNKKIKKNSNHQANRIIRKVLILNSFHPNTPVLEKLVQSAMKKRLRSDRAMRKGLIKCKLFRLL
jgi:hypothetical protein